MEQFNRLPALLLVIHLLAGPGSLALGQGLPGGSPSLVAEFDRSFIKRADGTVEPYVGTAELNNGDSVVILERIFKTYNDYFGLIGSIAGVVITGVGMLAAFQLGR